MPLFRFFFAPAARWAVESWREERVRYDLPARVAGASTPPGYDAFILFKYTKGLHTSGSRAVHVYCCYHLSLDGGTCTPQMTLSVRIQALSLDLLSHS